MSNTHQRQSGAVSLFMVVFTMLLMSVITISFLRIMTADQKQASGNDLAQSAYDSAQSGVEDAKRALIWYAEACKSGNAGACTAAKKSITSPVCNDAIHGLNGQPSGGGEIKIQQSTLLGGNGQSIDQALDQAYTCVTLQLDTDDYIANVGADQSVIIPLAGKGTFNTVTLQWFSEADLSSAGALAAPDTSIGSPKPLLTQSTWPANRPPVLRTQLMQVGTSFQLSDFDSTNNGKSNANTLFLYPSRNGTTNYSFTRDIRADSSTGASIPALDTSAPFATMCVAAIPSGGYSCGITLTLPTPVGAASDRTGATAYLRLTSFYVGAHVRVTLDGTQFNGVQPIVDSTGRANDVFRRVQSRVDLYDTTTFPYPDAAVDVNGNFCKNFGVTDTKYLDDNSCKP